MSADGGCSDNHAITHGLNVQDGASDDCTRRTGIASASQQHTCTYSSFVPTPFLMQSCRLASRWFVGGMCVNESNARAHPIRILDDWSFNRLSAELQIAQWPDRCSDDPNLDPLSCPTNHSHDSLI